MLVLGLAASMPVRGNAQVLSLSRLKKQAADTTKRDQTTALDSPRAALSSFLDLTRTGDFAGAAQFLDVPESERAQAPQLARELSVVLDRYISIDLDAVSGAAQGDTTSGLPAGVDQIGTIPGAHQRRDPVRLARTMRGGASHWVFSRTTVGHIRGWYDQLPDRWTLEHLPASLLGTGPLGIRWWQWLALPLLLLVSWALGAGLGRLVRAFIGLLARRARARWDHQVVEELKGPFRLGAMMVVALALAPWLSLDAGANRHIDTLFRALLVIALFWALWRLVEVWRQVMSDAGWARPGSTSRGLLALMTRAAKAGIAITGIVAVLATLGYPVAALLGGLGLGGLAFALAAQKTLENLFGAVSIGADHLFREGDTVTIDTVTGSVEAIGLRSTRIRTPERTIVSMPNGKVADARIETFAPRDRIRLACVLQLAYDTTAAQMRTVIDGAEQVLRSEPLVAPESIAVFFFQLGASSLDVQVIALFQTTNMSEFQRMRQDVLLRFMDVVERAGTQFAFPTQTVHIASLPAGVTDAPVRPRVDASPPPPAAQGS